MQAWAFRPRKLAVKHTNAANATSRNSSAVVTSLTQQTSATPRRNERAEQWMSFGRDHNDACSLERTGKPRPIATNIQSTDQRSQERMLRSRFVISPVSAGSCEHVLPDDC